VKGATVEAKRNDGWNVLHLAAFKGHQGVVELLLAKGAATQVKTNEGKTALHAMMDNARLISRENTRDITALLISYGSDSIALSELTISKIEEAKVEAFSEGVALGRGRIEQNMQQLTGLIRDIITLAGLPLLPHEIIERIVDFHGGFGKGLSAEGVVVVRRLAERFSEKEKEKEEKDRIVPSMHVTEETAVVVGQDKGAQSVGLC